MLKYFTVILGGAGVTRAVAPLDARTLVDVQVCRRDAGGLFEGTAHPAFGGMGEIGISIDGTEVLPEGFPLRWLSQVLYASEYRLPDRRLALGCWGAGSLVEVTITPATSPAVDLVAIFRYEDTPTEFLGIPYRYHVARRALRDLLGEGSPLHFAPLQRVALGGTPVAVAVDWDLTDFRGEALLADFAGRGVIRAGLRAPEHIGEDGEDGRLRLAITARSILDGLMVRVGSTNARPVEVPLGMARPSLLQSLEDSLVLLPPLAGDTVTVSVELPRKVAQRGARGDGDAYEDVEADVTFTSVVIERVKERSKR